MVRFPKGYRGFHEDQTINYQLNRWLVDFDEAEIAAAVPQITSISEFSAAMNALAERARSEERWLNAAAYFRAAEFFESPARGAKRLAYANYLESFAQVAGQLNCERIDVPYEDGALPVLRFRHPVQPLTRF